MKKNNSIFLLLYAQALGGKSGNFFNCEAFAYPPALSNIGNIRFGTKSEILKPILAHQMFTTDTYSCHPQFINFDAAAIVKSLKLPGSVQTFSDYKTHFWNYLQYIYHHQTMKKLIPKFFSTAYMLQPKVQSTFLSTLLSVML